MRVLVPLAALGIVAASAHELGAKQQRSVGPRAVLARLAAIDNGLRSSRYSHTTRVDVKRGLYEFDCSGMVAWVLRRDAPKAHGAVTWRAKSGRPLARDYYRQIAATPADAEPRWGWARVARVADAAPGDVIAWLKPAELRSPNTGHVAFVVEPPRQVPGEQPAFLLRIADASRYQHQDDSRAGSGRDGFGMGTILVVADAQSGAPVAYGWVGLRSAWVLETRMAIGRPVR